MELGQGGGRLGGERLHLRLGDGNGLGDDGDHGHDGNGLLGRANRAEERSVELVSL